MQTLLFSHKKYLGAAILFAAFLLAGCSRPATNAIPAVTAPTGPAIAINSVTVKRGVSIEVLGSASNLPKGACIQTKLLKESQPVDWWPVNICLQPDVITWQMVVPLGQKGAPAELESGAQYEMQAWWPDQPEKTLAHFPFQVSNP